MSQYADPEVLVDTAWVVAHRSEASILHLLRGLQPSLDEQKHPRAIGMLADRAHKQI